MISVLGRVLSNTKISQKITFVALIAGVSVLFLTWAEVRHRYEVFTDASTVLSAVSIAKPLFALQHELQKEKGQSYGYVASQSDNFRETLAEQQRITSSAVQQTKSIWKSAELLVSPNRHSIIISINEKLQQLEPMQLGIGNGTATEEDIAEYYDPLLEAIDVLGRSIFGSATTGEIASLLASKRLLGELKAIASVERALGANFFASNELDASEASRLLFIAGAQQSIIDILLSSLPSDDQLSLEQTLAQPASVALEDMRFALEDFVVLRQPPSAGSTQWFNAASVLLNGYRSIDLNIESQITLIASAREASALRRFYISAGFGLITIVAIAILSSIIVRDIIRQVASVLVGMEQLSDGKLDHAIEGLERGDEFGQMALALDYFRERLIDNRRLEAEAKTESERKRAAELKEIKDREELKARELAQQEEAQRFRQQEIANIGDRFRHFVDAGLQSVENAGGEVRDTASQFSDASARSKILAEEAVDAADSAAAYVQGLEEAAAQIDGAIQVIDESVKTSTQKAQSVVATVDESDQTIRSLDKSSQEIQSVVDEINDIAQKTRMLALNATIEAARAGAAGKGFAVVAGEVKGLADQTAGMTEQIIAQVNAISERSEEASRSMEKVVRAVRDVEASITDIQLRIDQQSAATQDIRAKATGATKGARLASTGIGDVDKELTKTHERTEQLSRASQQLDDQASKMRAALNDFIGELNA